jgi:hypothetical protein
LLLVIVLAEAAEASSKGRHGEEAVDERGGSLGSLLRSQIARRRCGSAEMTRKREAEKENDRAQNRRAGANIRID